VFLPDVGAIAVSNTCFKHLYLNNSIFWRQIDHACGQLVVKNLLKKITL